MFTLAFTPETAIGTAAIGELNTPNSFQQLHTVQLPGPWSTSGPRSGEYKLKGLCRYSFPKTF